MNAHVLRKRSLAKNRIFQLLPVLTLLVLWCQCFISAASIDSSSSSGIPINMLSFHSMGHMQSTTHSHRLTDSDVRKFYDTIAETVNGDDSNVSEGRRSGQRRRRRKITPIHPVDRGENGANDANERATITIDNTPNTKRIMSNRINNQDSDASSKTSDFIRRAFLHKRHKNRWASQLQMQRTKRRTINASHRTNLLHQRFSVLPKTIDNNSSARNDSHNQHGSNILNSSRTDANNNQNQNHKNNNNNNNDNYHHITANDNNYITINTNNDTNDKHNNENIAIEWRRTNDNHNNAYGDDRDDDDDMYKHRYDAYQRMSSMPLLYRPHHRFRHHHHRWYTRIERNRRSESPSSILKLNSSPSPSPSPSPPNTLSRFSRFSASSRMRGHPFGRSGGQRHAIRSRRFCTARDPATLAFTAPTVFEGKVRSMSSDRRRNFSVTFEVKEIFKQKSNLTLPPLVRLRFTYKNSSECDIYRERFRPVGHVGRDELEPGKLYIFFVNQTDLGNFTILGQPAKITRKTIKDVRTGAAEKYGKSQFCEETLKLHYMTKAHNECIRFYANDSKVRFGNEKCA